MATHQNPSLEDTSEAKDPDDSRSRSSTISSRVRNASRNLKSLSPPPFTRTLSPIRSTMAASFDTLARIGTGGSFPKKKDRSSLDLSVTPSSATDVDVAQPTNMAKSFVSLLTTASMYNGNLQDFIESEGIKEEDDDDDDNITEEPSMEETIHGDDQSVEIPLTRSPTLFELSVEEKLESKSKALALSQKLRDTFNISENDKFISGYPCWLMKDVLLQGHIYLTESHLMFLAFLPKSDQNKIALAGNLSMEALPSPRLSRYWAVLKKSTLTLYNSSSELYFPVLTIDLRYAFKAEVIGSSTRAPTVKGTWFKISTETKTYKLQADSDHSARSWVALLKKHIFASRNKGDCVTVKIPLQNLIDIEETPIFEAAETLRLKVLESPNLYALDDYFFMFFSKGPEFAKVISGAISQSDEAPTMLDMVVDSTANLSLAEKRSKRHAFPLRKILQSHSRTPSMTSEDQSPILESATPPSVEESVVEQYLSRDTSEESQDSTHDPTEKSESRSYLSPSKSLTQARTTLGRWTPKMFKSASTMWASNPVHYSEKNSIERGSEDEYLASPEETIDATKRFQAHFSLPATDLLVASYYSYLHRNVPTYGKIYLGSREICFRSLVPGFHTKMILPYKDIENCYKEKGFKFGYHGLVVVIHGHEELFLEFSSAVARDDCEVLLLKQLDKSSSSNTSFDVSPADSNDEGASDAQLEAAKIKLFEDKIHSQAGLDVPIIIEDHPLLDTSIKPGKSYKISLLTIGSRGDVQPYIALGLGLKKEGHDVTIITHKEFGEWILKHGLGFKEIAGNPTELMSLMVSHGSMNVGLIKEASSSFRGWIGELLASSWEACQGSEILIEAPSAMAGIHIAEALGIPYFRAFTMPWTRTRAYPHAFIVPDQKKGGSYNYLTHVLFENIFWKGISGQVNKWRKETLKLPKTNLDLLQQSKVPFLYSVSPTVMAPPVDYSDWIEVTGYWFLNEGTTYDPPQELVDFIKKAREDGKKLVYIGFGSIVVSNPKELTEAVVEAVLQADVRCILNKGWSERLGGSNKVEIELPYEVYNAGSLPHDWLFPQIDAAVHHGGSGTTGATLRAGLPTIIKPFFADQFFYANRVEDIGVGISLKKLNVKSLSKALKEATTNQRMIAKARAVSEKINKEDGVSNAISIIYRELEYARELIASKRKVQITPEEEKAIEDTDENQVLDSSDLGQLTREEIDNVENDGSWLLV